MVCFGFFAIFAAGIGGVIARIRVRAVADGIELAAACSQGICGRSGFVADVLTAFLAVTMVLAGSGNAVRQQDGELVGKGRNIREPLI
jgi:hypothetical protein